MSYAETKNFNGKRLRVLKWNPSMIQRSVIRAVFDLHDWLSKMQSYSDCMYGKGKIKAVECSLVASLLPEDAYSGRILEMVCERKREWLWKSKKLECVQVIVTDEKITYEFFVRSDGTSGIKFSEPARGALVFVADDEVNNRHSMLYG